MEAQYRGVTFFWNGKFRLRFDKLPTTVEQQADLLIGRGLIVHDREKLVRYLSAVGYYRLSAYWLPFEKPPIAPATRSKQFQNNVKFEDVLKVYIFDRKLRLLLLEAIERIEINVRSKWVNSFALKKGAHAHLNERNFSCPWKHSGMIRNVVKRVDTSTEVYNVHYKNKYTEPFVPPLWAVCESLSFGELSKWVSLTKDNGVKKIVAKEIGLPTQQVLDGVLQNLAYVRNICAHHNRLWNRRLVKRIPKIKALSDDMIMDTSVEGQAQPSNQIYNSIVVMAHIIRHQAPDSSYLRRMKMHLDIMLTDDERSKMGIPLNWKDRPIWQIEAV